MDLQRPTILALDDHKLPLRILSQILEQDYDFIGVKSIGEAESYIENGGKFDLLIIDIQLGGSENGLDYARRIRSRSIDKTPPIVVVSAMLDNGKITEASRIGVNDWVNKPVRKNELLEKISNLLTNPYCRTPDFQCDRLPVISWESSGIFYEFSPQIQSIVSGETAEKANQKMHRILEEAIELGTIDFTNFKSLEHELVLTNLKSK